ncbi:MAG: hypothetical protein KDA41_00365, partial [Planctomycetales bacterium]|nr:hypothetical protein [Planctomycetales bacterium]
MLRPVLSRLLRCWMTHAAIAATVVAVCQSSASAQLPVANLNTVLPAGARPGAELEVVVAGGDLDDCERLIFSHPGITAAAKMEPPGELSKKARPIANTFIVKVDGKTPVGLYEVRAVGRFGVTNPRTFQVSGLNDVAEAKGNSTPEQAMPVEVNRIVNAQADNDAMDYYKVHVGAGQRLLIDCWAERIDSRMDPSIVLLAPGGREVRRVHNTEGLDPVLELTADAEGDYIIGVYDFTFGGGGDYFYRLAVHQGPYIDFVFPPAGEPGKSSQFTLYGRNLPGGKPVSGMAVNGASLERLDVTINVPGDPMSRQRLAMASLTLPFAGVVDSLPYQLQSPQGASNSVAIGYASGPVIVEEEPANNNADAPQVVTAPCEYVGQFYPQGDRDWLQFEAKQGQVFWLDVLSHRLGLETDPIMVVESVQTGDDGVVKVTQVTANDDYDPPKKSNTPDLFAMQNRDPRFRFEAKSDGIYRVGVRDLYSDSRGDPRMAYRLVIRSETPDFQLLVFNNGVSANNQLITAGTALRRGESQSLKVQVVRRDGFDGEVEITADQLPPGVKCDGALVGGAVDSAELVLTADGNAPAGVSTVRIIGKAKVAGQDVQREARSGALVWGSKNVQQELPVARMTRDLAIGVVDKETFPTTVTAGDGKIVETCRGAKFTIPVKVARQGEFKEAVKVKGVGMPANVATNEANVTGDAGEIE